MASGLTFQGPDELWQPVAATARAFPDMYRATEMVYVAGDVVTVELGL